MLNDHLPVMLWKRLRCPLWLINRMSATVRKDITPSSGLMLYLHRHSDVS